MTTIPESALKAGVLDASRHARLMLDIDRYAARAGIAPSFIWTPAKGMLTSDTVQFLQKCLVLASAGRPGAVFVGGRGFP